MRYYEQLWKTIRFTSLMFWCKKMQNVHVWKGNTSPYGLYSILCEIFYDELQHTGEWVLFAFSENTFILYTQHIFYLQMCEMQMHLF